MSALGEDRKVPSTLYQRGTKESSTKWIAAGAKNARSGRDLLEGPRPTAGVMRLLFLLRGVDRGLNHVAVILEPRLDALDLALFGLSVLQRDEFLIAEPEVLDERVGHRLIIGEILVDYGGDLRGLVEVAQRVLGILEVAEVEISPQALGA